MPSRSKRACSRYSHAICICNDERLDPTALAGAVVEVHGEEGLLLTALQLVPPPRPRRLATNGTGGFARLLAPGSSARSCRRVPARRLTSVCGSPRPGPDGVHA